MNCIDWMSKRSKQRKTTKVIKLQWLASIGCQNDQNNAKLQNRSNYIDLHRLYGQNDQNKAKLQKWSKSNDLHRFQNNVKTIKKCWVTSQNIQNNAKLQNQSNYNELQLRQNDSKQRKTTKVIKLQWLASIGCQNDQNNLKLQNDQITMTCIDYTSKRSKQS